jgi:microcin C transport system substrate-binding protein
MRYKILISMIAACTLLNIDSVSAKPVRSIAMHGTAKYGDHFTHFDYVNPNAPKGGTLTQAVIGGFDSVNPFIIKGTPAAGLAYLGQSLIYDSLMVQSYDEPFSMYGLIADTIDIASDHKSVAFHLREEAKWRDGKPITAEDVAWTFETLLKNGNPFFQGYYGDVTHVETPHKHQIIFYFKNASNAELPLILSQLPVLPKHYWTQKGHDISKTSLTPPLGSGAYYIDTIDAGRSIVYKRDPDYWAKDLPVNKGRYNFDTLKYDSYRDDNVALEAFLSGAYDVRTESIAKLWAQSYDSPAVREGKIIKKEIPNQRSQGMQGFVYNIRRPLFQDVRVRKALGYAFDFEWSNKQFAFGDYTRTQSYFANSELASTGLPKGKELQILKKFAKQLPKSVFTDEYRTPISDGSGRIRDNLKQAITLLEEAGYTEIKDGIRTHEKTGLPLSFTILDSNPAFEKWALPFIRNLQTIGVQANFRVVDPSQYQNRINDFDFDMTIASFPQSDSPGNEQRDYWNSQKAKMKGSRNIIGIQNPVIDALIEQLIVAKDRETLVSTTQALDRVLLNGYYVIPQWHTDHWRLAWQSRLQHPEKLSGLTPAVTESWWEKPKN